MEFEPDWEKVSWCHTGDGPRLFWSHGADQMQKLVESLEQEMAARAAALDPGPKLPAPIAHALAVYRHAVCTAMVHARLWYWDRSWFRAGPWPDAIDVGDPCTLLATMDPVLVQKGADELRGAGLMECSLLDAGLDGLKRERRFDERREVGFGPFFGPNLRLVEALGDERYKQAVNAFEGLPENCRMAPPPALPLPVGYSGLSTWADRLVENLRPWLPELAAARARWTGTRVDTENAKTLRQIWQERAGGKKTWYGITYETLKGDRYEPSRRDDFPKPRKSWGKGSGRGNLYDPDEIEEYVKNRVDRRRV